LSRLFDLYKYNVLYDILTGRILCIAWHVAGDIIVTGGIDNIRLWSVNSGHAVQRLTLGRQEKNKETIVWCLAVTRYWYCSQNMWSHFTDADVYWL